MNKLKKTLALMAALTMTATAFVGCGGNDSSSTAESKTESSAEESSEAGGEESRLAEMAKHVADNEGLDKAWAPLMEQDILEIFKACMK